MEQPGFDFKDIVYSKITIAAETGYISYGTPVSLPGARKLSRSSEPKAAEMWGDGVMMVKKTKRGPTVLDLELVGLTLAHEADMFGETQNSTTKYVEEHEDDEAPLCAIGYKEILADGREKCYWEYWGRFEPTSEEYETFQGEVALRARTARWSGMARPCDKKFRLKADEDDLATGADLDEFFTATTLMAHVPAAYKPAG